MKITKNEVVKAEVSMNHWYYGYSYRTFFIEVEDDCTEQEIVNYILDHADRHHTFSEYKIKIMTIIGDQLFIENVDSQLIENWQYS